MVLKRICEVPGLPPSSDRRHVIVEHGVHGDVSDYDLQHQVGAIYYHHATGVKNRVLYYTCFALIANIIIFSEEFACPLIVVSRKDARWIPAYNNSQCILAMNKLVNFFTGPFVNYTLPSLLDISSTETDHCLWHNNVAMGREVE
eukprot:scaffold137751_cov22-Prasinocladus_malaysianus.AAC.1